MNPLIATYRRLDLIQQTLWFRIAASVVALAACGVVFGGLLLTSYSLHSQREVLLSELEGQNINERDRHAVSLRDEGVVRIGGREYHARAFAAQPQFIFNEQGDIGAPHYLVEDLLSDQRPEWAPTWLLEQPGTTWLLTAVFTVWLLLIVWIGISLPFVLTVLGTGVPVLLLWWMNNQQAMIAVAGIGLLTFTYVLLTRSALLMLARPNQICAVAHTVVKEASRSRISLSFIVLLLVLLPLLPLGLDPEAPLRYRVQTFISRSLGYTFAITAVMTLLLACATVAFEIRDRQIWHLVTKPLSRLNYLAGKWAGVMTVNLIVLLVAGVSTFTFIQYLRTTPVAPGIEGQMDWVQLNTEVLTARVPTKPVYDRLTREQVFNRVEQLIDRDPDLAGTEVPPHVRRELALRVIYQYSALQRTVAPGNPQTLVFDGLQEAKRMHSPLTLRYRFYILESDPHETFDVGFVFNDDPRTATRETYIPTMSHVVRIPPDLIRPDGTLSVEIHNLYQPPRDRYAYGEIYFEEQDLELMYQAGSFERNFLRAILLMWIKLAFLAMLGLFCATFLSFPVACLLAFTVFAAGTLGPFLAMALEQYEPLPMNRIDWSNIGMVLHWALQSVVRVIAQGLVFSLRAFGEYRTTGNLVEGLLIPWRDVLGALLTLGLVWSGLALFIGWLVLRSRQLAVYSGHSE